MLTELYHSGVPEWLQKHASPAQLMPSFAERAEAIQPTGVRRMFDMAGKDTVMFGLGEPDFQPPEIAIEAFHSAMLAGHNKYTTTAGLPELRLRIAQSWNSYRLGLDESNVCMTMSGTNALLNCMLALVNPGDNVLLPEPYFPLYGPDTLIAGGEARYYSCRFENEFVPNISDLEALVDTRTKAILYNFPSNPTGATLTAQQRDKLTDFARRHDLWIISDEVYDRIVYGRPHVSFLTDGFDDLFLINSFSKTFAMTGWRIGYVLSPRLDAMEQVNKLQYYIAACSNDAMQHGVLAAFNDASEYPEEMSRAFRSRRDLICDRLNAIEGVQCHIPHGAFYVFPRVDVPGMTSEDVAIALLDRGVLCSPGSAFGPSGEGHLRFAYTINEDEIRKGMDIVEMTILELRKQS